MAESVQMKHPSGKAATVAVGFSWPALLFGPFWAFAKRQWLLGLLLTAGFLVANVIAELAIASGSLATLLLSLVLLVGYALACGFYGNRWLRYLLQREGYRADGPSDGPQGSAD